MMNREKLVEEIRLAIEKEFEKDADESLAIAGYFVDHFVNKISVDALKKVAYYTFGPGETRREILRVAGDVYKDEALCKCYDGWRWYCSIHGAPDPGD